MFKLDLNWTLNNQNRNYKTLLFLWASSTADVGIQPGYGPNCYGLSAHDIENKGENSHSPVARRSISAGWRLVAGGEAVHEHGATRDVYSGALGGWGLTSGGGRRWHESTGRKKRAGVRTSGHQSSSTRRCRDLSCSASVGGEPDWNSV
jgi:hypothetical protein